MNCLSRCPHIVFKGMNITLLLKCGLNSTAEKKDIPWREMTREILESDVYKELEAVQNPSLVYPDCKYVAFSQLNAG